jgi:hydrogenase expression/formation protein HypE
LASQLDRIDRARAARESHVVLRDRHVTLSHGSGGKATHTLVDALFLPAFGEPLLDGFADAATIATDGAGSARLAFTTDSYVVSPLFFPGGDIGTLAVNGTINDLAMSGAKPLCLSLALILEEGLEIDVLRRVVDSAASAAKAAGVRVITGDTKVVPRGKADQLFINTSGVGVHDAGSRLSVDSIQDGDNVIVSGYIGDHGMAVMLAREALELETDIRSDSAALHTLVETVLAAAPSTRLLKDPTRGGVATTLNEIARRARIGFTIDEDRIPVRNEVRGACEILGLDPLHIANEGKLIAIVPADEADTALRAMHQHPLGESAAIIGGAKADPHCLVVVRTPVGGSRVLDMLVGDPLPRIC